MSDDSSSSPPPSPPPPPPPPPPRLQFDDGTRILQQTPSSPPPLSSLRPSNVSIPIYYEIERITTTILTGISSSPSSPSNHLHKIALQFPDELLEDAPHVCQLFEQSLASKIQPFIFLLGDNTYGSECCIDTISANHLGTVDWIVHYGPACFSFCETTNVIYSFGKLELDVEDVVQNVVKMEDHKKLLVLYDLRYESYGKELETGLKGVVEEVVMGRVPMMKRQRTNDGATKEKGCCGGGVGTDQAGESTMSDPISTNDSCPNNDIDRETTNEMESESTFHRKETSQQYPNRTLCFGGLEVSLLPHPLSSYTLLYLTPSVEPMSNQMQTTLLQCHPLLRSCLVYSSTTKTLKRYPTLPPPLTKFISRRYYLIQKTKLATTIGIIIQTHNLTKFHSLLQTLQTLIQKTGRGCYTVAIGKLNIAKIANFGEMDAYVLISCREFVMRFLKEQSRDCHVPIVTPYELLVALEKREWEGVWSPDNNTLEDWEWEGLANEMTRTTKEEEEEKEEDDDDEPYFNLSTGRYESRIEVPHRNKQEIVEYRSRGAEFLSQKEFRGLDISLEKEVTRAVVGTSGIASDYGNR